jgi:hypothetical protein
MINLVYVILYLIEIFCNIMKHFARNIIKINTKNNITQQRFFSHDYLVKGEKLKLIISCSYQQLNGNISIMHFQLANNNYCR